jgi:hypothetical protein
MAVTMSWAPRTLRRWPRWLRNNRTVLGAGPVVEPASERGGQLRVDWDVADAFAFAEDRRTALRAEPEMSSTSRATISLVRAPA